MLENHTNLCYVVYNTWQCLCYLNVYFSLIIVSKLLKPNQTMHFGPIKNVVCGQNAVEQNAGGQNASQICIGRQNAGRFLGRVDKMPVSSSHISMKI